MNPKFFLLITVMLFSGLVEQESEEKLTKEYIDKTDVIAIVRIRDVSNNYNNLIYGTGIKVFKGSVRKGIALSRDSLSSKIETGTEYLIYARKVNDVLYIQKNPEQKS